MHSLKNVNYSIFEFFLKSFFKLKYCNLLCDIFFSVQLGTMHHIIWPKKKRKKKQIFESLFLQVKYAFRMRLDDKNCWLNNNQSCTKEICWKTEEREKKRIEFAIECAMGFDRLSLVPYSTLCVCLVVTCSKGITV